MSQHLFPFLQPLLATSAPVADSNGLVIAGIVLAVVAIAAFFLLRKPAARLPQQEEAKKKAPVERSTDDRPIGAPRATLRIGADGKARKLTPDELIQEAAENAMAEAAAAAEAVGIRKSHKDGERAFLQTGLDKTRSEGFIARLGKLFAAKQIDEAVLAEVEEVLYRADLGVKATQTLLAAIRDASSRKELSDASHVWQALRQRSLETLRAAGTEPMKLHVKDGPAVLMVVGVNGSGKTTTIGKLAHRYAGEGRKVLVAAGDTFRAAAVDQLEVWCDRAGVPIHRGKENADPASVCFAAIERAKAEGFDLVIVDTAGRLHTNAGLMSELQKCARVADKALSGAPHEVLLVLDATMGQNAVKQAEQFRESVPVSAIALTKLDGTAKGGVVLAIAETLKIPVQLVGVGEKMQDLRDFDAELFVETLFAGH